MKLYESVLSANSRKVRAVAAELGLTLERVPVALWEGENREPPFLALNPNGKVPVLVDGGYVLWESHAILAYLATAHGNHRLMPREPQARADVERWLYWVSNHLDPALGALVFERLVKPAMNLGPTDPGVVERAKEETLRYVDVLDVWLQKRKYVAAKLSVADFSIAAHLAVRDEVELDVSPFRHVVAWLGRIDELPSWKASAPERQE